MQQRPQRRIDAIDEKGGEALGVAAGADGIGEARLARRRRGRLADGVGRDIAP
ncbi:MAG: hypothetical protein U1F37_15820 [Alphaproteobacteria bacterium]